MKLFTVMGASFALRAMVTSPRFVCINAVYVLLTSIVIGGGALYCLGVAGTVPVIACIGVCVAVTILGVAVSLGVVLLLEFPPHAANNIVDTKITAKVANTLDIKLLHFQSSCARKDHI